MTRKISKLHCVNKYKQIFPLETDRGGRPTSRRHRKRNKTRHIHPGSNSPSPAMKTDRKAPALEELTSVTRDQHEKELTTGGVPGGPGVKNPPANPGEWRVRALVGEPLMDPRATGQLSPIATTREPGRHSQDLMQPQNNK